MSTLEDIPNGTKSQTLQNQLRSIMFNEAQYLNLPQAKKYAVIDN